MNDLMVLTRQITQLRNTKMNFNPISLFTSEAEDILAAFVKDEGIAVITVSGSYRGWTKDVVADPADIIMANNREHISQAAYQPLEVIESSSVESNRDSVTNSSRTVTMYTKGTSKLSVGELVSAFKKLKDDAFRPGLF